MFWNEVQVAAVGLAGPKQGPPSPIAARRVVTASAGDGGGTAGKRRMEAIVCRNFWNRECRNWNSLKPGLFPVDECVQLIP